MKVVVISASPRKNANTQIVMKYVYEYAKSKNSDTKLINLSEGQIEYYRGQMRHIMNLQKRHKMTSLKRMYG